MSSTSVDMPSEAEAQGAILQVARIGILSYGLVYALTGWIALQLAFSGGSGEEASTTGALQDLAGQSFGTVLLWVIGLGLAAMALWQLASVFLGDTWMDDSDRRFEQAKHVGRTIVYGFLSFQAIKIVMSGGGGSSGGGSQEESLTATLLSAPAGQLLVGAIGLGIIAIGIYQIRSGVTKSFTKKLAGADDKTVKLGQVGYLAKGITLAIVGGLFGWAAITADAEKAGGMDQALQTLRQQAFGPWLLAAIGLGFIAYGVFCFFWARHPRP